MAASGRSRRAAAVAGTAVLVIALGAGLAAVTRPEEPSAERRVARVPASPAPALVNLPQGPKIPALIRKPESTDSASSSSSSTSSSTSGASTSDDTSRGTGGSTGGGGGTAGGTTIGGGTAG